MITIKKEVYFNTQEAADYIGKARQSIYQYYKQWGWSPYQLGANLVFKKADIDLWLSERLKPGAPPNMARKTESV